MKIKTSFRLTFHNSVEYNLINIIFLFIMAFSMFNILFWQREKSEILKTACKLSLIMVFMCEIFYIMIHFFTHRRFTGISYVTFFYLLYEMIVTSMTNRFGIFGYIVDGMVWPLTFITFEFYAMYTDRKTIRKQLHNMMIVSMSLCTLLLINNIRIHLNSSNHGEFGGNVGPVYFCLSFMGLILLLGSKKEKIFFAVWFAVMILASTKRGGFVIMAVGLCGYYIVNETRKGNALAKIKKYIKILFVGALVAGIVYFVMVRLKLEILDRLLKIKDDEGSGRIDIWKQVIQHFSASSTEKKIFGHGFHSVPDEVQPVGHFIYAHDSYLETLYDFGIVGVTWLIGIVIWLCIQLVKMIRNKKADASTLTYFIVEILVLSAIGYFFDESRFILCVAVAWGISLGNGLNRREQLYQKIEGVITC